MKPKWENGGRSKGKQSDAMKGGILPPRRNKRGEGEPKKGRSFTPRFVQEKKKKGKQKKESTRVGGL